MKKRTIIFLLSLIAIFIVVEITLRKVWGFGDMVLFQEDKNFEYIAQPDQERMRFGNRIIVNEYSMRSSALKDQDSCIVLGFGDSVINGGSLTDQDSLATTIVEKQLNGTRFLNISAGSWGPDNCAQYMQKYGDFNARMIILFVSSHDAHDNMTFEPTVGTHESYPDKQYPLATIEIVVKYIIPRIAAKFGGENKVNDLMINKNGVGFNPGFEFFTEYSKKSGTPLVMCLHAEKAEIEKKSFNTQGAEILEFCKANSIKLISGLEIGENASHFRDDIHLNEKGQKLWAQVLLKEINETITSCP